MFYLEDCYLFNEPARSLFKQQIQKSLRIFCLIALVALQLKNFNKPLNAGNHSIKSS